MWSVYNNNNFVHPLKYENGKSQEDSVQEILEAFKENDIVLFEGFPGSGKSLVALNVIKELGKGIIVVPTKPLERQYEESYTKKYSIRRKDGGKFRIGFLVGRDNFQCSYDRKRKASSLNIPCRRPLNEGEKRYVVARECPFFSPLYKDSDYINIIREFLKPKINKEYVSNTGKWYIFTRGDCPYYNQFLNYTNCDVIVMNYAKWVIETKMGRKPMTEIEVLDEYDCFFDEMIYEIVLSSRFFDTLLKEEVAKRDSRLYEIWLRKIKWLTDLKCIIAKCGDKEVKHNTPLYIYIKEFFESMMIEIENLYRITSEERYFELAERMKFMLKNFEVCYIKARNDALSVVFPYPDIVLKRLFSRSAKKILLMSGTCHSDFVLSKLFGIQPKKVYGRRSSFGTIVMPKIERIKLDERYWQVEAVQWEYWKKLKAILKSLDGQTLVVSHAKKFIEKLDIAKDTAESERMDDFLSGRISKMATTRANRGIDLIGDLCKNLIIPKKPNPDLNSPSIRALQHRLKREEFWAVYRDKAKRDLIQMICRVLRCENDVKNVFIIDKTAYEEVKNMGVFRIVDGEQIIA